MVSQYLTDLSGSLKLADMCENYLTRRRGTTVFRWALRIWRIRRVLRFLGGKCAVISWGGKHSNVSSLGSQNSAARSGSQELGDICVNATWHMDIRAGVWTCRHIGVLFVFFKSWRKKRKQSTQVRITPVVIWALQVISSF